ncbi:MAG: alpha/beta fold hydrolase [Aliiglaciecola sp.]
MRKRFFLTSILCTLINMTIANATPHDSISYENEQAIEFVANDGQTTDAFEGFIWVPENRNAKDSRKIQVSYVRFPATGKTKGAPIVYLSGGPGGSGIGTAKWRRFPLFMALREHADVIALDQRGAGKSDTLPKCQSDQQLPLNQKISPSEITQKYRFAAIQCQQFWAQHNIDMLGYTTVQNAWDLNDLRKHLGSPKISLWGISYGSHLALAALSLFEQHIDKVIIASAEGLDQTVKLPKHTKHYFQRVQQVIDQDDKLKAKFPDIVGLINGVHRRLEKKPLETSVPVQDNAPLPFLFQKHHMQLLASRMIADPNQYLAMLLNIYAELAQQKTEMLTRVLSRGMFNNKPIEFRLMPLAMDVASGISPARLKQVNTQASAGLLGDALNFPMPHLNLAIEGLDLGQQFRTPMPSDVPTLLLTGTLDGRTYVEGQNQAVAHLNNVVQVEIINAGHNLFTASPDVLSTMQDFIQGKPILKRSIVVQPTFIKHL